MVEDSASFTDPLTDLDPIMKDAFSVGSQSQAEKQTKSRVSEVEFPEVNTSFQGDAVQTGMFANIPVKVSVELGRSTISLQEIFELSEGSIIELDRLVGEPLDLVVNGQIVAKGEVVAVDNNFGLRIKTIISKQSS